jgi:hypothetical protein
MAITTDLNQPIGELRLLIGDNIENKGVKPGGANFTDAELDYFYSRGGQDLNAAAGLACETLSWIWQTHPDFSADGLTVKTGQISAGWWRAALRFRARRGASLHSVQRQDAYSQGIPANQALAAVDGEGIGNGA